MTLRCGCGAAFVEKTAEDASWLQSFQRAASAGESGKGQPKTNPVRVLSDLQANATLFLPPRRLEYG
jgi:hypothetical protein